MDTNKDGVVTKDELKNMLMTLCTMFTDEDLDELMKVADANQDGNIQFVEFIKAVTVGKIYYGGKNIKLLQLQNNDYDPLVPLYGSTGPAIEILAQEPQFDDVVDPILAQEMGIGIGEGDFSADLYEVPQNLV